MRVNAWLSAIFISTLVCILLFFGIVNNSQAIEPTPIDLDSITNIQMEEVVQKNPDVHGMRLSLANRYLAEGDFSNALTHFVYIASNDQTNEFKPNALAQIGWMSYESGKTMLALDYIKESIRLKKLLMRGGGGEEYEKYVEKYNPQTRSLYKRVAEGSAVGFVFSGSAGGVVGPKEASGFFHLFEILQKHKKGSEKGLDLVYDEIFERLHKQKRENLVVSIIDSLYLSSSVYISPEVR